eukprot:3906333-Rhodomonas_salina.1
MAAHHRPRLEETVRGIYVVGAALFCWSQGLGSRAGVEDRGFRVQGTGLKGLVAVAACCKPCMQLTFHRVAAGSGRARCCATDGSIRTEVIDKRLAPSPASLTFLYTSSGSHTLVSCCQGLLTAQPTARQLSSMPSAYPA